MDFKFRINKGLKVKDKYIKHTISTYCDSEINEGMEMRERPSANAVQGVNRLKPLEIETIKWQATKRQGTSLLGGTVHDQEHNYTQTH